MQHTKQLKYLIDLAGFETLSNVQQKVTPLILKNQNLVVTSPTGTGKTHAYLFGIFSKLTKAPYTQAVIVAPTRELALQISRFANELAEGFDHLQVKTFVGGEKRSSISTHAQLVIGTIGRLNDLYLEKHTLQLQKAKMIVLDEADMLVDQGFIEDADMLLSHMDSSIQTLVFSATIPVGLQPFLKKYLTNSKQIQVIEDKVFNPKIDYKLLDAKHLSYIEKAQQILQGFNPSQCLIFANSKQEVSQLAYNLRTNGYKVVELHKELTSSQRKLAFQKIIDHQVTYIVASDIAARGLDIEHVSHVISCGFPKDLSYFKHRAGRTGRAGKDGVCFTIYKQEDTATVNTLIKEGINFTHVAYQNGAFKEIKPFNFKPKRLDEDDKRIISLVKGKKQKVKPNYKKKQNEMIEKHHRKKRRSMIESKIKDAQKERAKKKSKGESL